MASYLSRATSFLVSEAYPWYEKLCRELPVGAREFLTQLLLAANFLALRQLVEGLAKGTLFDIRPYRLTAGGAATLAVDIDKQGRTRDNAVWVDSAVGMPDPTIRVGTDARSAAAGGVRVMPGDVNELGQVPADTRLYIASDVTITVYILERG